MNQPPKLADRLLRFFCAPHRLEEVQGDLQEEFAYQVRQVGERSARWRYWRDVLGFLQPSTLKRQAETYPRTYLINPTMLRNYFRTAWRNLVKNRFYSLINMTGLTVGLAVSTFIALYVWHEFHYDRFEPFADRTYRIMSLAKFGGDEVRFTGLHESFGRQIKKQIPEVEEVIRMAGGETVLQSDQKHRFNEKDIGFADAPTLSVLGLRVLYGDASTALAEPGRIVLTRHLAEKYFGRQNPVGKPILYDKHFPLTVSAVLDDLPTNSVIQFNGLVSLRSMSTLGANNQQVYKEAGFLNTFLVLRPGADVTAVEKKLQTIKADVQFADISSRYILEALPSLHLDSQIESKDTRQSLYILLTIALVILSLAIINYVSLTTARATKRAKEVGIRKAIGGQRSELIGQFFLESFLTTSLAFVLSLGLLQVIFPWANQALDLHMDNRVLSQGPYWRLIVLLWLVCSLLAGAYPALQLSRFRPVVVLKGAMSMRHGGAGLRQVFTTVQFTASIGLLICSMVLFMQMKLLRTKNLGINRNQVVAITIDAEMITQFPALRDAVRLWAGSGNVAFSNSALFTNNIPTMFVNTETNQKQLMVNFLTVDKPFFDMMGVRWQYRPVGWEAGPITRELSIYNQTAIREAGLKGNPIKQPAFLKDQPTDGVAVDFHVRSLHGPVFPMKLTVISDTSRSMLEHGGYLLVRLHPHTDVPEALAQLIALYERSHPAAPFDYYFLDDAYNKLYTKEERLARLFNGFTALTFMVACLGLLGLMTFSVEARTKEIGVRKVLGASVTSIIGLLSKDFLKLVAIAIILASPAAWWAMNQWLQNFAYKIDIEWWMFVLAGIMAVLIALLTVSFQSIRAALVNPVKSLRSE